MTIRAVVFDFDGVIVDTETPAFEAWRGVFAHHGAELTLAEFTECIGTRNAIDWPTLLAQKCGVHTTLDELRAARDDLHLPAIATLPVMPGVEAWIAEAQERGLRVAIASSSEREWIEPHLDRLGMMDHFETIASWDGEHTGLRPKPAPDLYELACASLDIDPPDALAVEDSRNGVLAAKAAGLRCAAVPNAVTAALDFSPADVVLDSLAAITLADCIAALSEEAR